MFYNYVKMKYQEEIDYELTRTNLKLQDIAIKLQKIMNTYIEYKLQKIEFEELIETMDYVFNISKKDMDLYKSI
jgi:hypothetical protein